MPGISWLHRQRNWWNRWSSWREQLSVAVVVASVCLLVWQRNRLSSWRQAVLGITAVMALGLGLRRLAAELFGPVFFYDLIRNFRQERLFFFRGLYATALFVSLLLLFVTFPTQFPKQNGWDSLLGATISSSEAAQLAERFFFLFLSVQWLAIFVLTPAYTATAVSDEKQRKTLPFLLASDLQNREIILGKLLARLSLLMLILATGLPILSFLQLLGGVDPNLVLGGFIASTATVFSFGSLGILNSTYARSSRGAVYSTYGEIVVYVLVSGCFGLGSTGSLANPFDWIGGGNIFVVAFRISKSAAAGTLATEILTILGTYTFFHCLIGITCIACASAKLRDWYCEASSTTTPSIVLKNTNDGREKIILEGKVDWPRPPLPPIGGNPLLWKELYVEPGVRLHPVVYGLMMFLVISSLSLAGVCFLFGMAIVSYGPQMAEFSNTWARVVGTPLACLMIVGIGVRASTSITLERDRQTLIGLLTTPQTDREILWAKWWSSILSVRYWWGPLGAVWGLATITGGISPFALPILLLAWWVYAALAATIGVWFSLKSNSSIRATMGTLLMLFLLGSGLPFTGMSQYYLLSLTEFLQWSIHPSVLATLSYALYDVMSWPRVLAHLTMSWKNTYDIINIYYIDMVILFVHALLSWSLWMFLSHRFGPAVGRMPDNTIAYRPKKLPEIVGLETSGSQGRG